MNRTEREFELPFYLNGTLPAATHTVLERELDSDAALALELDEVRALREALLEVEASAPAPPAALLAGVMAKIGPAGPPRRAPFAISSLRHKAVAGWGLGLGVAACAALLLIHPAPPASEAGNPSPASAPVMAKVMLQSGDAGRSPNRNGLAAVLPAPPGSLAALKATEHSARDEISATARQLARTGTIGLIVPDVTSAIAKVQRLTQEQFGALTALQDDAPSAPGGKHTAQITVSVPDDRFVGTLGALAALGGVTSRSVSTEDLTDSIVDDDARLRNLRREEADLLRIMDRSGKIQAVLDVEQQLSATRQSIEELDAEAKSMRRRVAYATITIDLSDEKTVPVAAPGPASQLGDAWRAALHRAAGFTLWLAAQAFVLIAFAPYLGLLLLAAYLLRRRLSNRN